jgi:hypothetical protein
MALHGVQHGGNGVDRCGDLLPARGLQWLRIFLQRQREVSVSDAAVSPITSKPARGLELAQQPLNLQSDPRREEWREPSQRQGLLVFNSWLITEPADVKQHIFPKRLFD